ncbi:AraC family transcriptional regulator [Pedobacter aquatilis]|uniref:helix-turn-helix domain-containing protein n=1 Tax=Pedobacter aquatilis TaxID=351343 RepID=UPI0025B59D89|nr:AraC family transcriptional regulator [Pedobacter aquatilis]MDN3587878.1 AraC family transcriptional regulator [Pedobacter aquatilis]
MINFFKYLPVSQEDESWGLTVLNAGRTCIQASADYPFKNHPGHHQFKWDKWRILQEYQVIYITNGQGLFESESCEQMTVAAGSIIFLFPNERHRYRPDENTGWDEHWIGLNGKILDQLVVSGYLNPKAPILYIGFNDAVLDLYNTIIENIRDERPGYQPLVSGAALHLIGFCYCVSKQSFGLTKEDELVINKARLLFRSNICNAYSPEQAAEDLNVGYSWFRKLFKKHTGLSPGQYYIQLKIEKAKELLRNETIPVKSVSFELNFQSSFYFSKIFKEKVGLNPTEFRKINLISSS